MISSDLFFRNKIPVGVLGAETPMGKKMIQALSNHPWFELRALFNQDLVEESFSDEPATCALIFSAADAQVEDKLAQLGYLVVSSSHVVSSPFASLILAGEINPEHTALLNAKPLIKGGIVIHPGLSMRIALALKPLIDAFGIKAARVIALVSQASLKSEWIEEEILQVLGQLVDGQLVKAPLELSVSYEHQMAVDGSLAYVSVELEKETTSEELVHAWHQFKGAPQQMQLPSAPAQSLYYFDQFESSTALFKGRRDEEISIRLGQLRAFSPTSYQFVLFSPHEEEEIIRSLFLTAELLVRQGKVYWS